MSDEGNSTGTNNSPLEMSANATNAVGASVVSMDAQGDQGQVLRTLICPLTLSLLVDPVMADDGHVYERSSIEQHFNTSQTTGTDIRSPMTRQIMTDKLSPVRLVANTVRALVVANMVPNDVAEEWRKSKDQMRVKSRLIQKANDGDVSSMTDLGMHYFRGTRGFYKDEREGLKWLIKAVESQDPVATYKLGTCYLDDGKNQCLLRALHYFSDSAAHGCDAACLELARLMIDINPPMVKAAIRCLKNSQSCNYKIMDDSQKADTRDLLESLESQNIPSNVSQSTEYQD